MKVKLLYSRHHFYSINLLFKWFLVFFFVVEHLPTGKCLCERTFPPLTPPFSIKAFRIELGECSTFQKI